jgi:hypothetical protein
VGVIVTVSAVFAFVSAVCVSASAVYACERECMSAVQCMQHRVHARTHAHTRTITLTDINSLDARIRLTGRAIATSILADKIVRARCILCILIIRMHIDQHHIWACTYG